MHNMNNYRWYNVEIPYNTEEAQKRATNFKKWLKDHKIKYESSGVFLNSHIEIYATPEMLDSINNALDEIVW